MCDPDTEVLKSRALALRQHLNLAGLKIGHGHSLELIAAVYGVSCWRALIAGPARPALDCEGARSALTHKLHALKYPLSAAVLLQIRTYVLLTTPPQEQEAVLPIGFSASWPEGLPHLETLLDLLPPALWAFAQAETGASEGQRHVIGMRNERRLRKAAATFGTAIPGAKMAHGRSWSDAVSQLGGIGGVQLDHTWMWRWLGRTIVLTQPYDQFFRLPERHLAFDQQHDKARDAGWQVETSIRSFYWPGQTVTAMLVSPA